MTTLKKPVLCLLKISFLRSTDELTLQGWMFYDKSFYLISTTEKSWTASREDCLQRNADLVVINSRDEQVCVCVCVYVCVCVCVVHFPSVSCNRCYNRWKQGFVDRLGGPSWIGLSDQETEGTFKWVDGTPMTSR